MIKVATDIAYLTGLDPNRSFLARKFPLLWHAAKVYATYNGINGVCWVDFVLNLNCCRIRIALVRLPLDIGPNLAWELWVDISRDVQDYDPEACCPPSFPK